MIRIKGFGCFPPLANNTPNVINPVGELSTYSATFASDVRIYKDSAKSNSLLAIFDAIKEVSSTEVDKIDPPSGITALALTVMEDLYNQSITGQLLDDRDALMQYLRNNYEGQIQSISFGNIVSDGRNYLPEYLIYEGTSTSDPYSIRLWFADDSFRRQFDGFEIRPVKMVASYDKFFDVVENVQAMVKNLGPREIMIEVDNVANRQAYTLPMTELFDWVNPSDNTNTIAVPWTVVIYGEAGKNLDAIKNVLRRHILDNSVFDEDQWTKIFPDIFGSTEFIIVPFWSAYAIPVDNLNGGVYSAANNYKELVKLAKACVRGSNYSDEYIENQLNIVSSTFKCVQLSVVGHPGNRDGVTQFANQFVDYLAVTTSSIDFDRMSDSTREFVRILNTLLITAETMTSQTDIPSGTLRAIRDDVLYITASHERVQYLVAARQSVLEKIPPFTGSTSSEPVQQG